MKWNPKTWKTNQHVKQPIQFISGDSVSGRTGPRVGLRFNQSVTPIYFCISDTSKSLAISSGSFIKLSMLEHCFHTDGHLLH